MTTMARKRGLGSLFQRADGRWVYQTQLRGVRVYGTGATPDEARADNRAKSLSQPAHASLPTPTPESVEAFLGRWLQMMRPPRLATRTHDGYTAIVATAIVPVLGDLPIATLGRMDVERAVGVWSEQRHPRTVAHYLACLRAALQKAVEWGVRTDNPATRVKTPRIPDSKANAFSEADERRLLDYARGDVDVQRAAGPADDRREADREVPAGPRGPLDVRGVQHRGAVRGMQPVLHGDESARLARPADPLYPLWLAAFRTGMRSGELCGLTWDNVDFAKREIRVERSLSRSHGQYILSAPKTNKSRRTIPMGDQLAAVLEQHRKAQMANPAKLDQGLVFCRPSGGPWRNDVISRRFEALCAAAGVPYLSFHSCRHSHATRLLERGARIDVVMKLMGHSNINTTIGIYGHVTETAKRSAIDLLEDVG